MCTASFVAVCLVSRVLTAALCIAGAAAALQIIWEWTHAMIGSLLTSHGLKGGMICCKIMMLATADVSGSCGQALRQLAAAIGHMKAMHEAIWHSAFLVMLQEPSHHNFRKGAHETMQALIHMC